ncbi:MAG TPA: thiamine pyrophosphate-requiring protein [Caldilineaceae bacterium]|nr:thiamine pyrophosphate-requiring protein [Caldilineaceae bacterium]
MYRAGKRARVDTLPCFIVAPIELSQSDTIPQPRRSIGATTALYRYRSCRQHQPGRRMMKVADAIAHILKAEGVDLLFAYPVNHLIEAAAKLDIRTVIVRQERIGLHMADAIGRLSSGEKIGVFAMQHGPGAENAFGGVAQAYGESSPVLVLPMGYPRAIAQVQPNFSSALNFRHVTKSAESLPFAEAVGDVMRRAFSALRNGRPRPALVEIPTDLMNAELPEPVSYRPVTRNRYGPDPAQVTTVAEALVAAERPVIYAGQGVHYAQAWEELQALAELLEAPVTTSLTGKSAFPETHPLALGCANRAQPKAVIEFLNRADLIFGIGCSFSTTSFGIPMPKGKPIIHATLDPADLNKDICAELTLVGDARLTLQALLAEVQRLLGGNSRGRGQATAQAIAQTKEEWLAEWMPKLTSNETPLSPYRVIWELKQAVDPATTIITHDAGSPRDQLAPFWEAVAPLSYIGWGKTTQLGYGLGLAMGAKLLHPEKLCINVWGDAAIGFTGMDFETAVRERIPILSILLNNFSMAIEIPIMPVSTAKYGSTDISGNYAAMAQAFGAYGERVTTPEQIGPAIRRGIEQTRQGTPALLEFITAKETAVSKY